MELFIVGRLNGGFTFDSESFRNHVVVVVVNIIGFMMFVASEFKLEALCPVEKTPNPPVSEHFLTNDHSANDITLIPLELTKSNRDSVRKAREAYLIERGKTLEPLGINKKDEM